MPNFYDFSKLENVREVIVNPEGWINPLKIEYGTGEHGEILCYFWRIKGTKHTFVIPVIRMDYLTEGSYAQHFEEALEGFREDYKGWSDEGWYAPWMQEYRGEYSKFITI
jgi:hypothetical protein